MTLKKFLIILIRNILCKYYIKLALFHFVNLNFLYLKFKIFLHNSKLFIFLLFKSFVIIKLNFFFFMNLFCVLHAVSITLIVGLILYITQFLFSFVKCLSRLKDFSFHLQIIVVVFQLLLTNNKFMNSDILMRNSLSIKLN